LTNACREGYRVLSQTALVIGGGRAPIDEYFHARERVVHAMKFRVIVSPSAAEDLQHFRVSERRVILDAVLNHLGVDANAENRRRKRLRPNPLAPWQLRVGAYRVFYEIEGESVVKVLAVGSKEHNTLLIRGKIVDL
jgi:mRNA interferase RelE/StbE